MAMIEDAREFHAESRYEPESPFAEAVQEAEDPPARAIGFSPWSENFSPFAEAEGVAASESQSQQLFAEAFAELRDESFDEALAFLAEETEQAVAERFTNETPASAAERERFADAHLSSVRFEAEGYLAALEAGLAGTDVQSLSEQQLDEMLDRFDPEAGELTPAGEEFIGKLVSKAKSVVKKVVETAKTVSSAVGKVAGGLLGPVLQKLKALIRPLLNRVLQFAIGRLPAPLQEPARQLARKFMSEAGEGLDAGQGEGLDEATVSPANLTDVAALAEEFDAALAEAMTGEGGGQFEAEQFDSLGEDGPSGRELEALAEARGLLIDRIRDAGEAENLGPAIEQFVPALLGALRLGIRLVGRPKVVGFLAGYLAKLIQKWVGPNLSGPLSNAIVDIGLRLITLEAETGGDREAQNGEAAPVALAAVVEDTVRRLAENEDYVFEDEELTQLAAAEAFSASVASHFPQRYVRPPLQQAPSLGGTFVTRQPRSVRTYHKYNRTPEVDVTPHIADSLPTFGGTTVGAVLRAAGATAPVRARMHIYQAAAGTSLPRMVRADRPSVGGARAYVALGNVHPLTPAAAGLLLREPRLGVAVPAAFTRSRQRIAVGQRFYVLEPIGAAGALALPQGAATGAAAARTAPSRAWIRINPRRARITVGLYLSEAEAQTIVQAIRQGRGGTSLLQALVALYREMDQSAAGTLGRVRIAREEHEEEYEELAPGVRHMLPQTVKAALRRKLRAWIMPALASWVRNNGEAFARAAAHPDAGVTIRIQLSAVPGLDLIRRIAAGDVGAGSFGAVGGRPAISISVLPGRGRGWTQR
jgi:hypothetical protein